MAEHHPEHHRRPSVVEIAHSIDSDYDDRLALEKQGYKVRTQPGSYTVGPTMLWHALRRTILHGSPLCSCDRLDRRWCLAPSGAINDARSWIG